MHQPSLFDAPPTLPEGFAYRPGLITPEEERALAERIGALDLKPFEFQGHLGKRRTTSFGWKYDWGSHSLGRVADIPGWLGPLRDKAARFAGVEPERLVHALVTEYAPGAGIGWHRDRPEFDVVIGVSLLAACPFRLRRKAGKGWERATVRLEPRSAYVMAGPARREWEHSIAPMDRLRYSVTFRTLAEGQRAKR